MIVAGGAMGWVSALHCNGIGIIVISSSSSSIKTVHAAAPPPPLASVPTPPLTLTHQSSKPYSRMPCHTPLQHALNQPLHVSSRRLSRQQTQAQRADTAPAHRPQHLPPRHADVIPAVSKASLRRRVTDEGRVITGWLQTRHAQTARRPEAPILLQLFNARTTPERLHAA
jgi:hypothetical protein